MCLEPEKPWFIGRVFVLKGFLHIVRAFGAGGGGIKFLLLISQFMLNGKYV